MKKTSALVLLLLVVALLVGGCSNHVGRYTKQGNSTDYMDLQADGTFVCIDHGSPIAGTYTVAGSTLTIIVPGRGSAAGTLQAGMITDNEGQVWKK